MKVLNIRLNRRGADKRPAVHRAAQAESLDDPRVLELGRGEVLCTGQLVEAETAVVGLAFDERVAERSRRGREVTHTCGCMRIPASSPTMSSRSWTIARHHARLTLFFSSTPSGP